MEFSIKTGSPEKLDSACLVVGVFEGRELSAAAAVLDQASGGQISAVLATGDMEGKAGNSLMLRALPGVAASRVLLLGLGKAADLATKGYTDAVKAAVKAVSATGAADALLCLPELAVKQRDLAWKVRQAAMVAEEVLYRFEDFKSKKDETPRPLQALGLLVAEAEQQLATEALTQGLAIAEGVSFARNLGNLPGNICTPTYLAEQAVALAQDFGLKCDVLERADMEALGMGSLLSVAAGSHQPPKLIVLHYQGAAATDKPVALVGKGITFDTGGISLKPAADMDEMKFDMCGAASVFGTIKAIARMQLPINVVGVIPTTENMPGGNATRPGDIVTSMSGQTIEILNTDAEGRLILCDALTYTERFEPAAVVDIATLTGACMVALGLVASGLLANNDALAGELLAAGELSHDRAWQMPLWEDYQDLLKSNFADMANIGGRWGGTITAACFLARFTKKFEWAHLDVAGTASKSGAEKGATGRPVPLLTHFLMQRAGKLN